MKRIFGLSGVPYLEQLSALVVTQLERLLAIGGAVPLAIGTLLAYFLLIGYRRRPSP